MGTLDEGSALGRWSEHNVLISIVAMVAVGLLLAALFWTSLIGSCIDDKSGWWFAYVCTPIRDSTPWTLLTGLAASPALLLTWYWKTTQRFRELRVSESQERTSRFAKAVELLGDDSLAQSLGGIYALGRIAEDSLRETKVVVDTLCAFVRSTPTYSQPYSRGAVNMSEPVEQRALDERSARMEAAIRVLSRLNTAQEPLLRGAESNKVVRLSLDGAQLSGLQLAEVNLCRTYMPRAELRGAYLGGSKLAHVQLAYGDLTRANLKGADLTNSQLRRADLRDCNLSESRLVLANLTGADLRGANLTGVEAAHANWTDAVYDSKTQFGEGMTPEAEGMVRKDNQPIV